MRVSITEQSYSLLLQGTAEEHAKITAALAEGAACLTKSRNAATQAQGELLGILRDALVSAMPSEEATP